MTNVTIQLSAQEIRVLKARTGETDTQAALKAWITRADPKRSVAQLRAAIKESKEEESADRGKRFHSGREAMRWLEN